MKKEKLSELKFGNELADIDNIQMLIDKEQAVQRHQAKRNQVHDDLKKQITEDEERKVDHLVFNEREYAINKGILGEIAPGVNHIEAQKKVFI